MGEELVESEFEYLQDGWDIFEEFGFVGLSDGKDTGSVQSFAIVLLYHYDNKIINIIAR